MYYEFDGVKYKLEIVKKRNKSIYIRLKDDFTIYVTAPYLSTEKYIRNLLDRNHLYLKKVISKRTKQLEKSEHIHYLGNQYDLVLSHIFENIEFDNNKIYVNDLETFNKWYKSQTYKCFSDRYEYIYNMFDENIYKPKLKIRAMKTRWGVCNRKSRTITLNSKLIEYRLEAIDYVIIHELSHLVHFNHSSNFWMLVYKYCPNYKNIRKYLKD